MACGDCKVDLLQVEGYSGSRQILGKQGCQEDVLVNSYDISFTVDNGNGIVETLLWLTHFAYFVVRR